jgi:hypothetical protein
MSRKKSLQLCRDAIYDYIDFARTLSRFLKTMMHRARVRTSARGAAVRQIKPGCEKNAKSCWTRSKPIQPLGLGIASPYSSLVLLCS